MRGYDFRIALSDLAAAEPSSRSHRRGEGPVKLGQATEIPSRNQSRARRHTSAAANTKAMSVIAVIPRSFLGTTLLTQRRLLSDLLDEAPVASLRRRCTGAGSAFASIRRLGVRLSAHANGAGEGAVN